MIHISKLKPGMVVWDSMKRRMGNTLVKTWAKFRVQILEVEGNRVSYSWNGNSPQSTYGPKLKWTMEEPYFIRTPLGYNRKPTREEKASRKLTQKNTK